MAKNSTDKQAVKPISDHPLFPAIVALWFAALLGLGSMVLPASVFETFLTTTGLAAILPIAAPPLGLTAKLLIAVAAAVIGASIGLALARKIVASHRPVRTASGQAQARKDRDDLAIAKARKPISAKDELGSETLDTPPYSGDGTSGPALIPGRRRSLAMNEDEGRSEYLQSVPLPGGELDFGQIAAAVTATISMDSLPRRNTDEPQQTHKLAEAAPEAQNEALEDSQEESLAQAHGIGLKDDILELTSAQDEHYDDLAPMADQISVSPRQDPQPAKARQIFAPPQPQDQPQDQHESPPQARFEPAGQTAPEPAKSMPFAPPASDNVSAPGKSGTQPPAANSFAPPAQLADPVGIALAEEIECEEFEEPLVFSAPSLARTAQISALAAEGGEVSDEVSGQASGQVSGKTATQPPAAPTDAKPADQTWENPANIADPAIAQNPPPPPPPLADLAIVELAERLGRSMRLRKMGLSAPATSAAAHMGSAPASAPSAKPEQAFDSENEFADASRALAAMPKTSPTAAQWAEQEPLEEDAAPEMPSFAAPAQPPAPVIPVALRPIELDFEADGDAEDLGEAHAEFSLPLMKKPAARKLFSAPGEIEEEEEAETDFDIDDQPGQEDETYSSLLDMASPFRPAEEFIRIEEPEDLETSIEPAVIFPGQQQPKEIAATAPEPERPVGRSPFGAGPSGVRPFDQPEGKAPPIPAIQTRKPSDPAEAERALRAALATLQRVSGAA